MTRAELISEVSEAVRRLNVLSNTVRASVEHFEACGEQVVFCTCGEPNDLVAALDELTEAASHFLWAWPENLAAEARADLAGAECFRLAGKFTGALDDDNEDDDAEVLA